MLLKVECNGCVNRTTDIETCAKKKNPMFMLKGYGTHARYEMEIEGSGHAMKVGFVTVQLSEKHASFREMFGDAVVNTQGISQVHDTVFVFNVTVP